METKSWKNTDRQTDTSRKTKNRTESDKWPDETGGQQTTTETDEQRWQPSEWPDKANKGGN